MEETKAKKFKKIIMGCAALLCIFFFTLPLVQCTADSSLTASGWEIATGTGDLYQEGTSGDPLAFLLLVIPIVLVAFALLNKTFALMSKVSIAGVAAKILFLIVASVRLNSDDIGGMLELTSFNWLVLIIYIGLCGFTIYCKKQETS